MIEIRKLVVSENEKTILNNVSLKWKNGQRYGIYGASGVGKSALLDRLAGAVPCLEGSILINGFDIQTEPMKARAFIGYLPQNPMPAQPMRARCFP